jgi:uncharacterized Zn-finger protein
MNENGFPCFYDFCGKSFNNKYSLQRHINSVHLAIKKFQCPICKKKLTSKIALKEHSYSHQNIKPISCPYVGCGLTFARSSLLCAHKKTHGSEDLPPPSPKKFDKREHTLALPEISEDRRDDQSAWKVPLHHSLI